MALLVALMASGPNQVQTIFMAMFSSLWFGCSNAVREIVDEQTIYRRERQTGLKIPSYILSKLTILSFVAFVQCFSVVIICLFVNHALSLSLPEAGAAILIMFLVAVNGSLIGLLISSLVSTPEKALTLFPLILIPELLLCGLFLPVRPIQTIIPLTVEQLLEGCAHRARPSRNRQKSATATEWPSSNGPILPSGGGSRDSFGGNHEDFPQIHPSPSGRHGGAHPLVFVSGGFTLGFGGA